MEKNKTSKYFKYAIGEIVLVVLGILIALSINNWNENRKAIAKSKNYLTEIIKDLESDTISFNYAIRGINVSLHLEEWALNQTNYQATQVDSLWQSLGGWYFNNRINDRTFQKIQNASESNLMGFESVSDAIINYYTVLKERVEGHAEWDEKEVMERQTYMKDLEAKIEMSNSRMHDFGLGQVQKVFPMRQDSETQVELVIAFANSTRGRNHFKNDYIRHIRLRNVFENTVQVATQLIVDLQQELDKVNE